MLSAARRISMSNPRIPSLVRAARRGTRFGFWASLTIFGSVFLAIYGGSAAWWLIVRVTKGAMDAHRLIEDEGGARALRQEFFNSAGRIAWLTVCCILLSAAIFAVCAVLSERNREDTLAEGPHPLDS